ncbi:hypothetical protein G7Y89_g2077 [Cudoniella acicularis]|uniref:Uncharacterized protein n=1 Tax=Cudoniella acicularis TaxID=354080 RepID=A0A8H4RVV6_9HELO|nr:hypothetical protein G7Y89_g2077 [Cudoniella acicularis]
MRSGQFGPRKEIIAHVLSLKAFNKYKGAGASRKKERMICEEGSEDEDDMDIRELSPESRNFMGPPPPSGTKRRPTKGQNIDGDKNTENVSVSPGSHIDMLNPKNDETPLKDFTRKWLDTPDAEVSSSADNRIFTFMHDNNCYNPEMQDTKIINFVASLRRGTELEDLEHRDIGIWYNKIESRVLKRINMLSLEVWKKHFISPVENGKYEKVKTFNECWKNKNSYWSKTQQSSPKEKNRGVFNDIYDDDSDPDLPSLEELFAPKAVLKLEEVQQKKNNEILEDGPARLPSRRKNCETTEEGENEEASRPIKRQKIRTNEEAVSESSRSSRSEQNPTINSPQISNKFPNDNDHAWNKRNGETLSSGASHGSPRGPTTPQATRLPRKTPKLGKPFTPTSPTPTVGTLMEDDTESHFRHLTPMTPQSCSSDINHQFFIPPSGSARRHEIFLTFPDKNLNYDIDNPISASKLRDSSLSDFLVLISEHSGIPSSSITCLTFTFVFASRFVGNVKDVVYKDASEQTWIDLKTKIKRLFRIVRSRDPREDSFEVLVDIGDTREVLCEEVDTGGV